MSAAPPSPRSTPEGGDVADRVVRPRRGLPSGRAVVGALLVVAAAVGTFATYLRSTAPPTTRWLVATEELRPGQVLSEQDVARAFGAVALELPPAQGERILGPAAAEDLVGAIVQAPLGAGDLVGTSSVAMPAVAEAGVSVSFPVPAARALGGLLGIGEVVDLLATFGDTTTVVARRVRVADVLGGGDGVGGDTRVVTVLVPDLATAQVVLNAADTGKVALVRGADPQEPSGPATRAVAQALLPEEPGAVASRPAPDTPSPVDEVGDVRDVEAGGDADG